MPHTFVIWKNKPLTELMLVYQKKIPHIQELQ